MALIRNPKDFGAGVLFASFGTILYLRIPVRRVLACAAGTLRRMRTSLATISLMLALGFITRYSGTDATLYLPGYRTYSRVLELDPPWYGAFPFDIFSEVLLPLGWSDIHEVHVQMVAGQSVLLEPDLPSVIERAELLRRAGPKGPVPKPAGAEDEGRPR